MVQSYFQTYFYIVLCVVIQMKYGILQEHIATESETLPTEKCTEEICTCAEIPRWNGVDCKLKYPSKHPKLQFNSFRYLQERMFQGLRIDELKFRDPNLTVSESVLEGILGLNKFVVKQSSIKVVPDFRFVEDSIRKIQIQSSRLTSLEGEHLQNLTKLVYLIFTNNYIENIDQDVFKGTHNVSWLFLDYNQLTSIPSKLLIPMKNLLRFSVSHNNLLHVDGLFHVTRPRWEIDLAFNNITHANLTQLFNLDTIQKKLEIFKVDLSYNSIKETSLSLTTCNMNDDNMIKIYELNVTGNEVRNLNTLLRCSNIDSMHFGGNQIQLLTAEDFNSTRDVSNLVFYKNQIRRIDTDTFKPMNTSLKFLNMNFNNITSINGSIKHLQELISLSLSYNSIQILSEDEFAGLGELSELLLQHNKIKSLGSLKLRQLNTLNIAYNDIEFIRKNQVPSTLKSIGLAGNPLKCDCHIQPFFDINSKSSEHESENDTFVCLLSGRENRPQKNHYCPDECSCKCIDYEGEEFSMFVDCSSRNLSCVPPFMKKNLTHFEDCETISSDDNHHFVINQNADPTLHLEDYVSGVNLENNGLEVLHAERLPMNLSQLLLANNKLTRFPESIIKNQLKLKKVTLSGNPWICDCDALNFKIWLTTNSNKTEDFETVRCGFNHEEEVLNGAVIWSLSEDDICSGINWLLILSVSFGVLSLFTFALLTKVIYTRYELNIKVFLYFRGFTFVKEEIIDQDKEFDAFISFAHKDDEFVIKQIVSEIEKRNPNIRLCLHYRHFRAGELISNNIALAVESSKKTVMILSRNFLESEWCILEFKIAHMKTLEDKVHRIIVITVGELPKKIDPRVKVYLESTTYLTWGENNFWDKLLFILPSGKSPNKPTPRFVADSVEMFNFSASHP